jgi:hypothetical protein
MSKMLIDRAAVEQALEALTNCSSEYGHRCSRCDSEIDEGGKVAAAIRAALEQEEQEPVVVRAEALDLILEAAEVLDKVRVSCDAWEKYGLRDFLPDELTGTAGMLRDGSALTHPPRREWQRDELLEALRLIAATDPVDAALDPQRAVRVARAAIAKAEGK